MQKYLWLCLCLSTLIFSCSKDNAQNSGTKVPHINLLSVNPTIFKVNSPDSVELVFSFSDPDADLGYGVGGQTDVFIFDKRIDTTVGPFEFNMPNIDQYISNPDLGMTGEAKIKIPMPFFQIYDSLKKEDTLKLEFYIKDRADNKSNVIETQNIYILK